MAKKMSLKAWINSQLKNKGLTVKQAKKNADKYKSIAAAKKAGSLYYTNKDGKVMIAAYAEDLKMPLKKPDSLKKKEDKKIGKNIIKESFPAVDTSKITKKDLPPIKGDAKKRIKEADKKSMDKYNYLFETGQIKRVPPKPPIRLHQGVIERQRERRAWEKKYGDKYNNDGTLKGSKSFSNNRGQSKKRSKKKMNMGGMISSANPMNKPTSTSTGLSQTTMSRGGMPKKYGIVDNLKRR